VSTRLHHSSARHHSGAPSASAPPRPYPRQSRRPPRQARPPPRGNLDVPAAISLPRGKLALPRNGAPMQSIALRRPHLAPTPACPRQGRTHKGSGGPWHTLSQAHRGPHPATCSAAKRKSPKAVLTSPALRSKRLCLFLPSWRPGGWIPGDCEKSSWRLPGWLASWRWRPE
jgi:hypothetical protein